MRVYQRIEQENSYDCAAACLAMVLGLPSSHAAQMLIGRWCEDDLSHLMEGLADPDCEGRIGVTNVEIERVLWEQGIPALGHFPREECSDDHEAFFAWDALYILDKEKLKEHFLNGLAIVFIPSMNKDSTRPHAIVIDHGKVYDPGRNFADHYSRLVDVLDCIVYAVVIGNPGYGI